MSSKTKTDQIRGGSEISSKTKVSESRRSRHFIIPSTVRQLSSSLRLVGDSLRRLGKSAMSLTAHRRESRTSKRLKSVPQKIMDLSVKEPGPVTYIDPRRKVNMDAYDQWHRKVDGERFRDYYIFDGSIDKKAYINSSGITDSWEDKSVGHLWVAVYGVKLMCVAWKGDLELKRYPRSTQISNVHRLFALNVISQVEDIKRSTKDSCQTLDKHVKKPFAVVCLIPSTTDARQESGDEVIEASGAVNYLKDKLKSGSDFDRTETIQTAISALQHECNQEFTADDIWVCVLQEGRDFCLKGKEIEGHLAEINKRSPKLLQTSEIETNEFRSDTILGTPLADQ